MFRHVLLSSAALALLSTVASAADLPARKVAPAPVSAPIFTWTGFYVGAQIGGTWTNDKVTSTSSAGVPLGSGTLNGSGAVGGLHAGYNMQTGAVVFGLEGDIEASSLSKSSAVFNNVVGIPYAGIYSYNSKIDAQGSIRGRLGYAMGPALLYVTGGLAIADFKTGYNNVASPLFAAAGYSFSSTRTGWTLGGGLEYAFNANWSARVEYRYNSYGNVTNATVIAPVTFWSGESLRHSLSDQTVRVGISYHFASPVSPVVARY